ncbi:Ribonuclease P protein component [Sphingomonas antarctica]
MSAADRSSAGAAFSISLEGPTDEAHVPAQQSRPRAAPRFPSSHVDGGGSFGDPRAPQSRPQEAVGLITLSRRADFLAANKGRRRVTPGFILLTHIREGDAEPRVGFTVTKKIGNAVVRNRMKRRFRALAREVIAPVAQNNRDYVLIGRAGGIERDYATLARELAAAL